MELDPSQLFSWLMVVVALVALPLLSVAAEAARRRLGPPVLRLGERVAAALEPEDELDPFLEAVRAQARQQKLVADVQRLRRLVATDMAMSATRQLGNRIAYASLVAELEALREAPAGYDLGPVGLPSAASVPVSRWEDDLVLSASVPVRSRDDGQRRPAVEVLELGSPRRRA
ncbi:hypothetical protein GCM10009616_03730 [Microlunatus lacustris]